VVVRITHGAAQTPDGYMWVLDDSFDTNKASLAANFTFPNRGHGWYVKTISVFAAGIGTLVDTLSDSLRATSYGPGAFDGIQGHCCSLAPFRSYQDGAVSVCCSIYDANLIVPQGGYLLLQTGELDSNGSPTADYSVAILAKAHR